MGSISFIRTYRTCPRSLNQVHPARWGVFLVVMGLLLAGCRSAERPRESPTVLPVEAPPQTEPAPTPLVASVEESKPPAQALPGPGEEISLFDGQTLGRWKSTDFGGQGKVYVKDEAIHMEMGNYMTGITWTGPVIPIGYEITLDAMRVEGNDFFCTLTFPVGDKSCSLVLGGWGGSLCGLSTIDYFDASENPTTRFVSFKSGQWYHVRLRVEPGRIQAWLDDEDLVDLDTTDRHIDVRLEVDPSRPLGIATWITTGAVRNIYLRRLSEPTL
jgi:hypothetical protein